MEIKNNDKTKHRYNLASALSRTSSRFLDLVFICLLNVGFYFSLFFNETFATFPIWKFATVCFLISLSLFIYFILVPFFSGGYTIFSAIFKIRIYTINLKTITTRKWFKNLEFVFFVQLLVREALSLLTYAVFFILLGIISFISPDLAKEYLKSLSNGTLSNSTTNYVQIVFSSLFSIAALLDVIIIVNVVLSSKKRSFADHISNTVVIKMVDVIGGKDPQMPLNYKNKESKIKYNLPGELNIDDILKGE